MTWSDRFAAWRTSARNTAGAAGIWLQTRWQQNQQNGGLSLGRIVQAAVLFGSLAVVGMAIIIGSVYFGASLVASVPWMKVAKGLAILAAIIVVAFLFWKMPTRRMGLIKLAAVAILAFVAWHYWPTIKKVYERDDAQLIAMKRQADSLRAELKRTIEGKKEWEIVVRRNAPDSIHIAQGDSIFLQRQDSLPYRVIVAGNKMYEVAYPIKPMPKLPLSGWIKVELDSTATADSIRINVRTFRGNWTG